MVDMPQEGLIGLEGTEPGGQDALSGGLRYTDAERVALDALIQEGRAALERFQRPDGHWVFELEADVTIPAEYVLLGHYLDEIDQPLDQRIGVYLRRRQTADGGWSLYPGGDLDVSASVKAYFALKLIGDPPDAPHMVRARRAIVKRGGAARANVFTRITLALFGQVPWRAVPVMPVEIMLLPRWFPFHLEKVSYWSRTVIVPLLILMTLKPQARNPRKVDIRELFRQPPEREPGYIVSVSGQSLGNLFVKLDGALRLLDPLLPKLSRGRAIKAAVDFIQPRLNGEDGLGGIFPAMANAVMAFDALGYAADHPDLLAAKRALRRLVVEAGDEAWCQPCMSPVWDTALAAHAMLEADANEHAGRGLDWLVARQITDVAGDWTARRPHLAPGGWPFEYRNDHYPDVDDTAAVVCALHRADPERYRDDIARAVRWVLGMQSADGGWGSFDADNTHDYLNEIPFADHGALLDPPTADVTARCISMLCETGHSRRMPALARAIAWLKREQEPDGSWFGRWGTNYVYGTWCAL
ncbi:MAG: squalene--hopene cyclase, partial [Geminicoccaceae bacterium]|nr:squalene--hopene cyclase [Geminicoccaceae bacterium]